MSDVRLRPPSGSPAPAGAELDGAEIALEPPAAEVCRRYFVEFPADRARYGEAVEAWCRHDSQYLLSWMVDDLELGADGTVLGREVEWLATVLDARDFPLAQLARHLEIVGEVLGETVPDRREDIQRLAGSAAATVRGRAAG